MSSFSTRSPLAMRAGALIAVVVTTLGIAACSSSAGSSSTSAASTNASSGAESVSVASAKSALPASQKPPTDLESRTPLTSKPPTGKTVVMLQCELAQCHNYTVGMVAAAKVLGWTAATIDFTSSDPATLNSALQQALRYKPVAVAFPVVPISLVQPGVLASYKQAGVVLVPIAIGPAATSDTIPTVLGNENYVKQLASAVVNWFIADSNGHGKALIFGAPFIGFLAQMGDAYRSSVAAKCPGCSTTTLNVTPTQLANNSIVPAIVSALRKNPGIKYLLSVDGSLMPGLPAALQTAGVTGVRIAGAGALATNIADLKQGTEQAWVEAADEFFGWGVVDIAARHVEGLPIPDDDGGLPSLLITKSNENLASASGGVDLPADYPQQFSKLWRVTS